MAVIRTLLAQRHLAVLICAAALLVKLLVPAGYMIDGGHGHIAITICSGTAPVGGTAAMEGMDHSAPGHGDKESGKAEMPCAFAGLSAAALGAIDPVQLAALIAFVMAAGLAGIVLPLPSTSFWLRPPLRAPPTSS